MNCDWLRQLHPRTARRWLTHVDLVLGASDYIADRIREGFPELAKQCRTPYNGTDLKLLAPRGALPDRLRQLADELYARFRLGEWPVVLYVGGFAVEKGTLEQLLAFELVLQQVPDATLLLVGAHNRYFQVRSPHGRRARGEAIRSRRTYRQEVERLVARLGDRVVVAGGAPHDELAAYYALPMGCGLPVAGTAHGGTLEIVEEGATGLLVPPGDVAALAAALVRLCRDRALATAMGSRARARVAERFTWRTQAARLAVYYDELVRIRL
jgi:glycosyltransferase involved in cell wall biosynthesis